DAAESIKAATCEQWYQSQGKLHSEGTKKPKF
ncbi:hypothetical protein FHG87_017688, partial [Trinorchestia longiramus]